MRKRQGEPAMPDVTTTVSIVQEIIVDGNGVVQTTMTRYPPTPTPDLPATDGSDTTPTVTTPSGSADSPVSAAGLPVLPVSNGTSPSAADTTATPLSTSSDLTPTSISGSSSLSTQLSASESSLLAQIAFPSNSTGEYPALLL